MMNASERPLEREALIADVVLAECARGERLVAWIRAITSTAVGLAVLAAGAWPIMGTCAMGYAVCSWIYALFLRRARYRAHFSAITVSVDAVWVLSVLSVNTFKVGGASQELLGVTPMVPLLFFQAAQCGVRQNPWASWLVPPFLMAGVAVILVSASPLVDRAGFPQEMRAWAEPRGWTIRALFYSATAVLIGLEAWNGRRMAERAGRAMQEHSSAMRIFGRYLAPQIRDEVLRGAVRAQTREVTVLFTDLRNFTTLSEQLSPQELLERMNAHFAVILPVVHEFGGTVNKFIGDALMATFGAPIEQPDHASRAVRAGQEMLRRMASLNEMWLAEERPPMLMGVGIATGQVVVGVLGDADRVEYAVLGDAVNTAARLEGMNREKGTSLILSARTREAVGDAIALTSLGRVQLKGKAEPVEIYTAG
jgi:class 3 adenylate cyclase